MPDYHLLGLGNLTSLVTGVQVRRWGGEVTFRCLYDPSSRQPYLLIFTDCREIDWNVHEASATEQSEADLIGILLGKDKHRQAAVITTNIFEVSVLYGQFEIRKVAEGTPDSRTE